MCRWVVYIGNEQIKVRYITQDSSHNIIQQTVVRKIPHGVKLAMKSAVQLQMIEIEHEHPDDAPIDLQRNSRFNIDGFGLGLYLPGEPVPCVYKTDTPARNDVNVHSFCSNLRSNIVFSHIRAASGGSINNAVINCHPFKFDRFMFMHNGGVSRFGSVKREVEDLLSEGVLQMVRGTTDSEHIGALFYQYLYDSSDPGRDYSAEEVKAALELALYQVVILVRNYEAEKGINETSASSLNLAVSDGKTVVVCRYRNSVQELPPSLFYCPVKQFSVPEDSLVIESDYKRVSESITAPLGIMVASEPLTEDQVWIEMQPFTISTIQPGEQGDYIMKSEKLAFAPNNEHVDDLVDLLNVNIDHITYLK